MRVYIYIYIYENNQSIIEKYCHYGAFSVQFDKIQDRYMLATFFY